MKKLNERNGRGTFGDKLDPIGVQLRDIAVLPANQSLTLFDDERVYSGYLCANLCVLLVFSYA